MFRGAYSLLTVLCGSALQYILVCVVVPRGFGLVAWARIYICRFIAASSNRGGTCAEGGLHGLSRFREFLVRNFFTGPILLRRCCLCLLFVSSTALRRTKARERYELLTYHVISYSLNKKLRSKSICESHINVPALSVT
jgi:hypothetical protein